MILCCGEALIDMIPAGTVKGRSGFVPCNGGSALNTAITLARIKASVGLLAALSHDQFGRQLDQALSQAGVDRSLIMRSKYPTTLAFVHLDEDEASYSFYDENSAMRRLTPDNFPPLPARVKCLLLGGISLCNAPGADAFEALSEPAGDRLIMLDPNVRPGFIGDETAYRARLDRMMNRAHILKLSQPDLDWLVPGAAPWGEKLDKIAQSGPSLVLFTQGAKGALACHRDGRRLDIAAPPVTVTDSVGAGDAFNAGFLAHLQALNRLSPKAIATIETGTLQAALASATQVTAQSLTQAGGS